MWEVTLGKFQEFVGIVGHADPQDGILVKTTLSGGSSRQSGSTAILYAVGSNPNRGRAYAISVRRSRVIFLADTIMFCKCLQGRIVDVLQAFTVGWPAEFDAI